MPACIRMLLKVCNYGCKDSVEWFAYVDDFIAVCIHAFHVGKQ